MDLGEGLNHEQSLAIALLVDFMEARSMILGLHIRFGVERLSGIFPCQEWCGFIAVCNSSGFVEKLFTNQQNGFLHRFFFRMSLCHLFEGLGKNLPTEVSSVAGGV